MRQLASLLSIALATMPWAASAATEYKTLSRADGSTIDWFLERRGAEGRQGILVLTQGSGCGSVTASRNLAAAKSLLPEFAVVTVEKYGVAPGASPRSQEDCSPVFFAHNTISQRVSDYAAVLQTLKREAWWSGDLALFGGSEGGAVVQIMAAQVRPNAAVIFSAATGIPFREAFISVLPPELAAEAPAQLARARRNPMSSEVWGGASYRWWADIVDRPLWEDALKAEGPWLVVQGARDQSNPVASARALRDRFAAAGRCNLTYWEYGDYDHTMSDSNGVSHLPEVLASVSGWLRSQLVGTPATSTQPSANC